MKTPAIEEEGHLLAGTKVRVAGKGLRASFVRPACRTFSSLINITSPYALQLGDRCLMANKIHKQVVEWLV